MSTLNYSITLRRVAPVDPCFAGTAVGLRYPSLAVGSFFPHVTRSLGELEVSSSASMRY